MLSRVAGVLAVLLGVGDWALSAPIPAPQEAADRSFDTALPGLAQDREGIEFFEKKIRPVLSEKCYTCHSAGAKRLKANFRLDTREGMLKGGDMGPSLKPGSPDESLLIRALRYKDEELQMPPKEQLPAEVVADFEAWVKRGAPDPRNAAAAGAKAVDFAAARKHWAFQPPRDPAVPKVKRPEWVKTPIDAFVLAKLEEKNLAPAPPADRRTLIRRATLDLIGLPPSPEEIDAFLADRSPDAFAKVVDRLLASPRTGERWGRHWLDVARYSDTKGYVFQEERRYPFAYTYRDWVIRALNEDMPYDRFILLQLAADRLATGEDKRDLAAMGFLTLGRRFLNRQPDIIDDRLDVLSRGLMALTVSCARCHDHKFDPIPIADYYSLYGVFASSQEPKNPPLIGGPQKTADNVAYEKELASREGEVSKYKEQQYAKLAPALRSKEKLEKYFLAAIEARNAKDDDSLRALGQKFDVSGTVAARWRDCFKKAAEKNDPVFAHWRAYGALAEQGFAEKAGSVEVKGEANPKVAEAFAAPPASLQEVAQRYAALLAAADQDAPHADPSREALRLALRGPDAPPNVPLADVERLYTRAERDKQRQLEKRIEELRASHPGAPAHAHALQDLPSPVEPRVFVRGNANNPGDPVPRRFLGILSPEKREPFKDGSGRLELAKAIASRENPLTARVLVNRVWLEHFGAGIVRTPSDFGTRSDAPTHPELLDWLAVRFTDDLGWSMKKLHRLILLSSAWQQSSEEDPRKREGDPENLWLSRMNRRRLDFEAMRDSLLAVTGQIDLEVGGKAVTLVANPTAKTKMEAETIKVDAGDPSQDAFARRRSVYLFIDRQNLPGTFRDFDFASPDTHSPQRYQTTVPQQALFLMNSGFVLEQARLVAARPEVAGAKSPEERVQKLHRAVFGRPATKEEAALGLRFVEAEEGRGVKEIALPAPAWQYGFGEFDEAEKRVKSFTPLPHFTGTAWQGGPKLPDPKLGWVFLSAEGGHPGGTKALSAIRRWTAPRDGAVSVSGTLAHKSADGDGVVARIVSSDEGPLASWTAHNTEARTEMSRIEVKRGETIDFVVECRREEASDGFAWAPVVKMAPTPVATAAGVPMEWSAQAEFAGPPGRPRRALGPWEKYAQVLLLTNEFMFVD